MAEIHPVVVHVTLSFCYYFPLDNNKVLFMYLNYLPRHEKVTCANSDQIGPTEKNWKNSEFSDRQMTDR